MKLPHRRQFLHLAAGAAALPAVSRVAWAQSYPTRPITMVVPFAAGGPTDSLARTLAERMRVSLGHAVIIENTTGAGGSVGVGRVVHAVPDGYTVGIGNWSTHVVNGAIYSLSYDLINDLEPVAMLPGSPQLIVTNNAVPAKDLGALLAWLKTHNASAGTAGPGSASHVAGLYFQKLTGTDFPFVPYRGTGPALQDLMAGQIDVMFDQASNSLAHVRDGKIRAYAVTSRSSLAAAPEIPTVDEAGIAGFYTSVWHGVWAPKGHQCRPRR
jgi:tripartite-type tricarboxylate transporter receptor subunit TctC